LINYNKSLEQTGPVGKKLYQLKRDESELDNFNLLYVTCTRAIEQLYIISEYKSESSGAKSYAHFFIRFLKSLDIYNETLNQYEFGSKNRVSKKVALTKSSYELKNFVSSPWRDHNINVAVNAQLLWQQDKQESIAFGNLIHDILAIIKTETDVKDAVRHYHVLGYLKKEDISKVEKIILRVVTHPDLKMYFQQNNIVYNEREILTNDKEIIIPDRFIIDQNNEVVLIDYKTGKQDKKYHVQLLKYAETLERLGYKVKKRLLVYISDMVKIEEV
jgi:ATP-dependent exoDNAse (exonuclease V) beta subunit